MKIINTIEKETELNAKNKLISDEKAKDKTKLSVEERIERIERILGIN